MFNIWNYYGKKEIFNIFNILRKELIANNSAFFHYSQVQLTQYLNNQNSKLTDRFYKFYYSWQSFQNKKRIIQRFLNKNKVNYPNYFNQKDRIIIDQIYIDYKTILLEINVCKSKKIPLQYSYTILIKKIIKDILYNQLFYNKKIKLIDINIQLNKIIIVQLINLKKQKKYTYKLTKFLLKYQKLFPKKYGYCKANIVISKNWQDLLLQSTFKKWSSCINLISTTSDNMLMYSCTNGIKAGNLVAYCIFDYQDNKDINEIMNDNGYHGLMYQRSFWRCNIKRYVNKINYNDYIFCAQHTSYGTIIQNIITYQNDLFNKINLFLINLNNTIKHSNSQIIIYKLPYKIHSDLHSFNDQVSKTHIYYFNQQKIKNNFKKITKARKQKFIKLLEFNQKVFTNDIIALLSVFNHFSLQINTEEKKLQYVLNNYLNNKHYILNNTKKIKNIIFNTN